MNGIHHLRGGGASLLLDARSPGPARVVHWGRDLGDDVDVAAVLVATAGPLPRAVLDVPVPLSLVPEGSAGFRGRPGLTGSRAGADFSPAFVVAGVSASEASVDVEAVDEVAGLALRSELALEPSGVLRLRHVLRNAGSDPYAVGELGCVLPVPAVAEEVLDLTGRWCRERHPQRRPFDFGTWLRESRRGRTGHDASLLVVAGTEGFSFRGGEVWGVHLGWSGDHRVWAERLPTGDSALGASELLGPGELVLEPGDEYATPWVFAAWSERGLDGLSAALHGYVRARPGHVRRPRPVVLNTWEAVYFDHDLDRLKGLADTASGLGVERFVLDDGWFRHRRDDTAGLGDWYVDEDVWPDGLHPLVHHVRGFGMQFGLWVEPEMVNPDSDLFRAHPDWVLGTAGRLPPPWRGQQVVDLVNPGAWAYLFGRLDALLSEYDIGYLKWDHNRDLVDAGHDGRPAVHAQTLATYALLDELRAHHPGVEIESCSSGGARADLGILARTDRVWASDTNDALERQSIQRWTQLLLPPELVGSHVGPARSHTTGRVHDLSFRAATALFGHFGMELDVTALDDHERAALAEAIGVYKDARELLHTGEVVRADHPDSAAWVHGVVAADRSEALFAYVQLATSVAEAPAPARLPGLDPDRVYRAEPVSVGGAPRAMHAAPPGWLADGAVELSGRALEAAGLAMPVLAPEQALVLRLRTL